MKPLLTIIGLAAAMLAGVNAQVLSGTYDFSGGGNDVSSFAYNGSALTNAFASDITKVGINSSSSTGNFRGNSWSTGPLDSGKYIAFTLTAGTSYNLNLISIGFGVGRSATGPVNWEWRTSVDSFASAVTTYTTVNVGLTQTSGVLTNPDADSSWSGNVLNLSDASYQGLSSVTLRLYAYNAEGTSGTGGLQGNLSFAGSVAAVPEPTTWALIGLGATVMVLQIRRRRALNS